METKVPDYDLIPAVCACVGCGTIILCVPIYSLLAVYFCARNETFLSLGEPITISYKPYS